jgi:hypothetical protein
MFLIAMMLRQSMPLAKVRSCSGMCRAASPQLDVAHRRVIHQAALTKLRAGQFSAVGEDPLAALEHVANINLPVRRQRATPARCAA